VFGFLVGVVVVQLLVLSGHYRVLFNISMSVGDIVTDIMFIKQLHLRINYLQDMITLYRLSENTSSLETELEVTTTFYSTSLSVILFLAVGNCIATMRFGAPTIYFLGLLRDSAIKCMTLHILYYLFI